MQQFSRDRIRIGVEVEQKSDKLIDSITSNSPRVWRGVDIQIEFALIYNGEIVDVSEFSAITFEVRPYAQRSGNLLMSRTLAAADFNAALSLQEWTEGTSQHGIISFAAAETNLDLNGANAADFWFVLSGVTNTAPVRRVTFGGGKLTMIEDGSLSDVVQTPPLGSSILPIGSVYDATGNKLVNVVQGRTYLWTPSGNDTSLTNGTQVVTEEAVITAQGSTITLHGTPDALITATLRYPLYFTADQSDARYLKNGLKKVNDPGVFAEFRSSNNAWRLLFGISDAGKIIMQRQAV